MFCPICGSKLPEDARFCPECGSNMAQFFTDQTSDQEITPPDYDPGYEEDSLGYGRNDSGGYRDGYDQDYPDDQYDRNYSGRNSNRNNGGGNGQDNYDDWYDEPPYEDAPADEGLYEEDNRNYRQGGSAGKRTSGSRNSGPSGGNRNSGASGGGDNGSGGNRAGVIAAAAVLIIALIGGGAFLASRFLGKSPGETSAGSSNDSVPSAQAPEDVEGKGSGLLGGLFGKTDPPASDSGSQTEETSGQQDQGTDPSSTAAVPLQACPVKALERPSLYSSVTLHSETVIPAVPVYRADSSFSNVVNMDAFYLNDWQKQAILENGFCVWMDGWDEFYEVYENNRYSTKANFVTVDSMMHTYHLYFSYLLKNLERDRLFSSLSDMTMRMQEKAISQLYALRGTEWEDAALRNAAFFSVAASLLDDGAAVPSEVSDKVSTELSRIYDHTSIGYSTLADNYQEDYSQYTVRGYYEGDPVLERYFRAMMWYGRMNFTQMDEDLDRSALLITMALDDETLPAWESIYTITSFFAGASDDCCYYEYKPILDEAYGTGASVTDLPGNDEAWEYFHSMTALMDPPQINSMVFEDDGTTGGHEDEAKGYRFMGQRFTIDGVILQNLIYSNVGESSSGGKRMLPDALDVPAALGSDTALDILEQRGNTSYQGYSDNMQQLRDQLERADDGIWFASLYSQWLYTLKPLLEQKGDGYPVFMQNSAWTRKNLQSFLGSYTELKHDTVLYSKQAMAEMGGGPMETYDDRGYVEAEPDVFRRLEALTQATRSGLSGYGLLSSDDDYNLSLLQDLASSLALIAEKELRNELPTTGEFDLIRTYGGQLEHFWQEVYSQEAESSGIELDTRNFPAAIVTDIATNPNGSVKELGTGRTSTIYVLVSVDGSLRIASGSVFSFYQFEHPLSDRLTDTAWRQMIGISQNSSGGYNEPSVSIEDWTTDFQRSWRDEY